MSEDDGVPLLEGMQRVLDSGCTVFVDSGITSRTIDDWFREGVLKKSSFAEINLGFLSRAYQEYVRMHDVLLAPHVRVVPKVQQELADFTQTVISYRTRFPQNVNGLDLFTEAMYWAIGDVMKGIADVALFRAYERSDSLSDGLHRLVQDVAEKTSAKRSYHRRHGRESLRKCDDARTDEQLVASALYRALAEGAPSVIVTSDSDVGRILKNTRDVLMNPRVVQQLPADMQQACGNVFKDLHACPVDVFFITRQDNLLLDFTTRNGRINYVPSWEAIVLSFLGYVALMK